MFRIVRRPRDARTVLYWTGSDWTARANEAAGFTGAEVFPVLQGVPHPAGDVICPLPASWTRGQAEEFTAATPSERIALARKFSAKLTGRANPARARARTAGRGGARGNPKGRRLREYHYRTSTGKTGKFAAASDGAAVSFADGLWRRNNPRAGKIVSLKPGDLTASRAGRAKKK